MQTQGLWWKQSLWDHTLTFFPQFLAAVEELRRPDATVVVVGASDGRLVLPLAAAGYRVIAVERDPFTLHGGEVSLPGDSKAHAAGLAEACCDAVWTSCSWHYSANRHRLLADFVGRMQSLVRQGGLFGAEFMMPVEQRHTLVEHYTSPERLARHFGGDWDVRLTLRTGEFIERPHRGQPHEHTHRMGLLIAARTR
ncbi:class I SAM-dependent methyltransferase [Streptomyces sp. ST1015]|nr:class I SAM-dependent methyltransferase [Streptomyces sp. ST1015]